jgi:1,2-diacylglycerol 3-beta-glucosyltransferase
MSAVGLLVSVVVAVCCVVLLLPVLADMISLSRIGPGPWRPERAPHTRFLFLIPAHDEQGLIASCVASVVAMQYPRALVRIVVIADNCTDGTADAARQAGAECLERNDATLKGKPHALAWALSRLSDGSHDAVVILDADAIVDPGYASALNRAWPRNKAIECYDDVRNPGDSALTRMAAVLSAGRFRGSFALKQRAGITVPLSDGMCLGVDLLRDHPWRAFGLSEDWEFYAILTAEGARVELCADAHLYAQETGTLRQSESQRRRWLTGKLDALRRVGPALIASRKISWHQKLDTLAELAVPGPAVHLGVAAMSALLLFLTAAPASAVLVTLLAVSLARPFLYAVVGIAVLPDRARTLASFTYLPVYTCWRLVVAAGSVWPVRSRERPWVRTARE